jgi:deazaflavin-dependent oxidoreductase (nitroreductase family)
VNEPIGLRILRRRMLVRAPIALYRLGLGFLFGRRMLLLEHAGRRTGRVRRAVLEVTDRPGPGRYVVVSGFGDRAQWFRNVTAEPRVRISVGTRRSAPATAHRVPRDRAAALFADYPRRHPRAWARLEPTVRAACGLGPGEPLAPHVPVVELVLDLR